MNGLSNTVEFSVHVFTLFLVSCWFPEATAEVLLQTCADSVACLLALLYFHLCGTPSSLKVNCSTASLPSSYCLLWTWVPTSERVKFLSCNRSC